VLVSAEVYERLKALLGADMPDSAALMNEVMADDDANDPYLESYQHYQEQPVLQQANAALKAALALP
jgi:hypothetical protein